MSKCMIPTIEARSYANTVSVFMAHKPLDELLYDAVLTGFRLCKVKYKIEDEKFEKQMDNQPTLFEWADSKRRTGAK